MLVLGRKNEKNYFINATKTEFTEADLNNMYQTYSVFLEPYYDMMEFMENDEQIVEYPLSKFKETASYKNNITILFNSKNDKLNVKRQENILKNIRIVRKK
ncbi:MAG: hypothetical protein SOW31_09920 [Treponema sp.]|nr:hypothetical protein [Treponema sp.]